MNGFSAADMTDARAKGYQDRVEFERYTPRSVAFDNTPAAPGIELRLREMLEGWKNSDYPLSYEGQCAQKALNACIADVEGVLIDARPQGVKD